jgi:hypothetical protein
MVSEFYCGLLNRFSELSITRKYISEKWDNFESWMRRYLLNEDAFQGQRKVTNAVAQFLTVMSEIAYRNVDVQTTCTTVQGIYSVWFKDIKLEVFSNKLKKNEKYYLTCLLKTPEIEVVNQIRISEQCESLEKLGKVVDSKVVQGVLIAIESVNMAMAVINCTDSFKKISNFANDTLANGIGLLLDQHW